MVDFTDNKIVLKDMRICLRFFANTTHTKLKKKPEEYTMEEMLDLMEKMKQKNSTKFGRFKLTVLDLLAAPGFLVTCFLIIVMLVSLITN